MWFPYLFLTSFSLFDAAMTFSILNDNSSMSVVKIVGGVFAGLAVAALLAVGVVLRRRRRERASLDLSASEIERLRASIGGVELSDLKHEKDATHGSASSDGSQHQPSSL